MHPHRAAFRLAGRVKVDSCSGHSTKPLVHGAALASLGIMLAAFPSAARAQAPNLGTAANFAVLAGSTVSNTGPTVLLGSLGVSPGNAVTGFPPGSILAPGGVYIGDAVAVQAQIDLAIGYNAIAARPATSDLTGQNLGGLTLTAGVYNFTSAAQLTGSLTLNALGNPNAIFIFNIGSTLTTSSAASVTVIGGGLGSNVYWRVGSSATLGTTTAFVGDILALSSITLNTGANITCGSALAQNGAVTLDTNNISIRNLSACAAAPLLPTGPTSPGGTPPGGAPGLAVPFTNGVVAAINRAFADAIGPGNTIANFPQAFLDLAGLSPAAQAILFRQLAGEGSTGFAPTGVQAMNSFLSLVLNPFAGNLMSDNRNGFGPSSPVLRTLGYASDGRLPAKAPAQASIDRAIAAGGFDPGRWGIWGAAYGAQSQISGSTYLGTADRSARVAGFAAGLDYRVLPNTIIGFALGGGGTNFGLSDGLGGARSDMFQAAIYASTRFDAAYVSATLAYAWHDVTTNQYLSIVNDNHLSARFNANNFGARVEGGYRFVVPSIYALPELGITPYGALQAQILRTPSYSETGSVFARSYDAFSTTGTRTEIGTWLDQAALLDSGKVLILRGRAAWAHDLVSDPSVEAMFVALPGYRFTVLGAALPRDLLLATAGAELRFANGFAVAAQFDGEFGDRASRYGGSGRVRYNW